MGNNTQRRIQDLERVFVKGSWGLTESRGGALVGGLGQSLPEAEAFSLIYVVDYNVGRFEHDLTSI